MLASLREVMEISKKTNTAIGAINTPNLECLLAALKSAEELETPIIIAHAECHESVAKIEDIGVVMVALAKASKVKVCVHLDHSENIEYCKKAISLGFTSVMIDKSTSAYEKNIKETKEVVNYAHKLGVDVEAELGRMPNREAEESKKNNGSLYTDVSLVNDFISSTGIDALAIAFGTAHGIYKTKPILNMEIISEIRKLTEIPLVMHGGSGISENEYREVIKRGINKINYYTYMSYAGYAKVREYIDSHSEGFYHDMALEAQKSMKENITKTLKIFSNK